MCQHKLTGTGLDNLLSQHHRTLQQPRRFNQPHPNLFSIPNLPILLHLIIAASYKCLSLPRPPHILSCMARPLSSASSRSNQHHVPDNLTALQGATSAFNATTPLTVKDRVQKMGSAVFPDSSPHRHHRNDAPPSYSPPDTDSMPPPEVGSVKDKIGIFAANSRATSPLNSKKNHDTPETDRRDLKLPIRSSTPQQVAARLASERSPVRNEKSASLGSIGRTTRPSSQSNNEPTARSDNDMPAPKQIRSAGATSPALQNLLREDQKPPPLPRKPPSIPRKPISQTTPTSSQFPSQAQLAAARSSPSPSPSLMSRKPPPPLPSRSSTVTTTTTQSSSTNPRGANSSVESLLFPQSLEEKKPALPPRPRPNGSSVFQASPRCQTHNGIIMQDLERTKTPSMVSLSNTSHNNSSSSTLDRSSAMDEESLSNAMIASSLASAHAPPPKKIPPTPPKPRRRSRSRSILSLGHHHGSHSRRNSNGRLPSPTKGLRQTLRDPPKPETQHNHHHHHRHRLSISRHPHKHHEGDRKRYQGTVSEQERKRYEGVWAANKGILIPTLPPSFSSTNTPTTPLQSYHKAIAEKYPSNASDMVLNLVVRDIWSRSNLPSPVLSQIWDLVDRQKNGLLNRDEFVVGMWLIDQQLKGHKLPARVPDSVWDSVKRLVAVAPPPHSHHHHSLI